MLTHLHNVAVVAVMSGLDSNTGDVSYVVRKSDTCVHSTMVGQQPVQIDLFILQYL